MPGTPHHAKIVYHDDLLAYDFGSYHPLRPERLTCGLDLLRACGLWAPQSETLVPTAASVDELQLVHDRAYIEVVTLAGEMALPRDELVAFGLAASDNPPFPDMHQAASLVAGGAVQATRAILDSTLCHAFHPAGGLHHAHRRRASGFCIYNDPALAAAVAVTEYSARVLYLDFDCHHGDGVQSIFFDDPRVLTVSFHEDGRWLFPGTGGIHEIGEGEGRGYAVNMPYGPYTTDASWLEAIEHLVPPLVERFRPDLIISSHGADIHRWDPLTHLAASTAAFLRQAQMVHQLAHHYCDGKWIAVGSGGYDWRRVVPRSWAIVWAEMSGRALPERTPQSWLITWSEGADEDLPLFLLDDADSLPMQEYEGETARINRETLESLRQFSPLLSGRQ